MRLALLYTAHHKVVYMKTTKNLHCFGLVNPTGTPVDFVAEPIGVGPFEDAWRAYRKTPVCFSWVLTGTDEGGLEFSKLIWHIGNGVFVDEIGAPVNGVKDELTIFCNDECDVVIGSVRKHLSIGENNFLFSDFTLGSNGSYGGIAFYKTGTTSSAASAITGIDFANMVITLTTGTLSSMPNLEYIKRMKFVINTSYIGNTISDNYKCTLVQASTVGRLEADGGFVGFCKGNNDSQLRTLDLRGFNVRVAASDTEHHYLGIGGYASMNPHLELVDIRDLNTTGTTRVQFPASGNCIKTLIIGNFTNESFATKTGLSGTGKTLICTTEEPPKLKNCSVVNGVVQYDASLDWTATDAGVCRFSTIYVPSSAVTDYQSNTYITGGEIGVSGWSRYANIIKDIATYNG